MEIFFEGILDNRKPVAYSQSMLITHYNMPNKPETINIRCNALDKDAIKLAAKISRKSITEFMMQATLEKATNQITEHHAARNSADN